MEVLEYFGKLSLLVALVLWIYPGIKQRKQAAEDSRKSRDYVAWETINSAVGKPGNAGRNDALADLTRDSVSLTGISLAGGIDMVGPLNLSNARMERADFSDGTYDGINFSCADFTMSKWDNAVCLNNDFRGACFWGITFKNTKFNHCDFGYVMKGKKEINSIVQCQFAAPTSFFLCNFTASSSVGIWNSVAFEWCNFAYAQIWPFAIGTNVSFEYCNMYGARTSSPEFIKFAYHQRVVFTNVTSLEEWHHCVTNVLDYKAGSPEFMAWASNQFITNIKTNDVKAWLDWSRENLHK